MNKHLLGTGVGLGIAAAGFGGFEGLKIHSEHKAEFKQEVAEAIKNDGFTDAHDIHGSEYERVVSAMTGDLILGKCHIYNVDVELKRVSDATLDATSYSAVLGTSGEGKFEVSNFAVDFKDAEQLQAEIKSAVDCNP